MRMSAFGVQRNLPPCWNNNQFQLQRHVGHIVGLHQGHIDGFVSEVRLKPELLNVSLYFLIHVL